MKRLVWMLILGVLGPVAQGLAYDGPSGAPQTYDVTLNDIRVVMVAQPKVINGMWARFELTAHVPLLPSTMNRPITIQIRKVTDTTPFYTIIDSCTVTPTTGAGTTVAFQCAPEQFILIGGELTTATGFRVYPHVTRGDTVPANAVIHDGNANRLTVPVVLDDTYEENDSLNQVHPDFNPGAPLTFPPSNTIVINDLSFRDEDNYSFFVPPGGGSAEIHIDFWNDQCDVDMWLYDQSGEPLAASLSSIDDSEQINIAVSPGSLYFVSIIAGIDQCPAFYNLRITVDAPDIVTITAGPTGAPNPVPSTGSVALTVAGSDTLGHALNYEWSQTCSGDLGGVGTFSNRFIANPVWTAPANPTGSTRSCTIRVRVDDDRNNVANGSYSQGVGPAGATITITTPPGGLPSPVTPPATVALNVAAMHSLLLPLSYSWTSNCAAPLTGHGSFSPGANVRTPTWTPPPNLTAATHTCTMTVTIADGQGQSVTAGYAQQVAPSNHSLTITAGPSGLANPVPSSGIVSTSLSVVDTLGHALTYSWSANCASPLTNGTFSPNATSPTPTWNAPANTSGSAKNCTIAVTVTDGGFGQTANGSYTQTVSALVHGITITAGPTGNPNPVASGAVAAMSATAVDTLSHPVTYAWSSLCPAVVGSHGTFSNPAAQNPNWTAPANLTGATQTCVITVVASDGLGVTQTGTLNQGVQSLAHSITFSTLPNGVPNAVGSNAVANLTATAVDSLTHAVGYQWTSSCPGLTSGTFSNASAQSPQWTAPINASGNTVGCTIQVTASDGLGQTAVASYTHNVLAGGAGTLTITAGPSGTPNPVVSGNTAALSVTPFDSLARPLTYAWTASCVGAPNNGTFSNAAAQNPNWTAPVIPAGTTQACTMAVTVSNNQGQSANGSYTQNITAPTTHTLTITNLRGTPNPSGNGQPVALSANIVDSFGHSLLYLWQASCAGVVPTGTFSPSTNVAAPTWTPPVNPTGGDLNCLIRVTSIDSHGLNQQASFVQRITAAAPTPTVTITTQPSGTPNPVASSGGVALSVTAVESLGNPLTYNWTATCAAALGGHGAFSNAASQNPTWTAPANSTATPQTCNMQVVASNGLGQSATASYNQTVNAAPVTVTFTTAPSGTPNPVPSAGLVTLATAAIESLGRPLTYQWTATCAAALGGHGAFSNATAQNPTWTAPANTTAADQTCNMQVVASNGFGQSATASYTQTVNRVVPTVTITAGPAGAPNPVASSGGVAMSVTAVESFGNPLNYQWTAVCAAVLGGHGTFVSATAEDPSWTAPINGTGSPQTCAITVVAANGLGQSATANYTQTVTAAVATVTITAGPSGTPNAVGSAGVVAASVTAVESLGRPLTYQWTSSCPALGGNGSFASASAEDPTWTAPANTTGSTQTCTMQVVASNGFGQSATGSYSQQVTTASSHTLTVAQQPRGTPNPSGNGQPVALSVTIVDSFGHPVSYLWQATCAGIAATGTFSPNANAPAPTWTPPANTTGADLNCLIRVLAIDTQGLSVQASFIQRVTATTPTHAVTITQAATGGPNPVATGGTAALSVTAVDSLGHALSYAWSAVCAAVLGGHGTFSNAAAQNPNWTAPANNTGSTQTCAMSVVASDGQGQTANSSYTQSVSSAAATVTITAGPTGTPNPVASGGTVAASVSAVHSLGGAITYQWQASCTGSGGNGSFTPSAATQNPTFTAPVNTSGSPVTCAMQATASGGAGVSDTESYTQTVNSGPPPHTLAITAGPAGAPNPVATSGAVALSVTAADSSAHALTYNWSSTCSGLPGNGSFSPSNLVQSPTWNAPSNTTGSPRTCAMQVVVNDGQGLIQTGNFTQTVNSIALNHTLTITTAPNGTPNPSAPGSPVALAVTAVDSQAHLLNYLWQATCAEVPGTGTFLPSANAQSPTWTPPAHTGDLMCLVRVTVIDNVDKSVTSSFVQRVLAGAAPAHTLSITTSPNGTPNPVPSSGAAALTVGVSDSLGHALTYQWAATCPGLGNGSFTPNNATQSPTWTAPANLTGSQVSCSMQVTVSDGGFGQSVSANYVQHVSSVPHSLTITSGPSGTPNPVSPAGPASLTVTASDSLAHALTYLWQSVCAGLPNGGTFAPSASAQSPTWTPPVNGAGTAFSCNISVLVSDTQGTTTTQSFTQNVNPGTAPSHIITITTPPAGSPNPVASSGNAALSSTAVDSLGHALSYAWLATCPGLPGVGSFANGTTANPIWTAPTNATATSQSCNIQVTVSDSFGQSAIASYTQNVSPGAGGNTLTITSGPGGTPNPVASAGTVLLDVVAVDSQSNPISYLWQATCAGLASGGTFSPSNAVQSPSWTAPVNPLEGQLNCLIRVTVVAGGKSATASYTQQVSPGPHTLSITTGPEAVPNPVDSDSVVSLTLAAVDSRTHELSYQWQSSCPNLPDAGSFQSNPTSPSPSWIAPTNYTNANQECTIQVTVSDGLDLSANGSVVIVVSPAPVPVTIIATTWLDGVLDPPNPPASNLSLPNFAVVVYRQDGTTEVHAFDAFSLSAGREWELLASFAQGEMAMLKIYRNASSGFSPYWGANSGNPAWRTNPGKQELASMLIEIQPDTTYTIRALIDLDGDGLDDGWETSNGVSEPLDDEDADGLDNLGEFQTGTDPNDADTDDDGVNDGPEVTNGDRPADPTDWLPPALRVTVGNETAYVSWNGVLDVDPAGAVLRVERVSDSETWSIPLDATIDHHRLTTLPSGGGPLANGTEYRLSLVLSRGSVTREPLAAEVVLVTPGSGAFTPTSATLFLHGFGGRGDRDGTFSETFDFALNTLGWTFGGRFCLPGTGVVLTPLVDDQFSGTTMRASSTAAFGPYGDTDCSTLNALTEPSDTANFFSVDFGNNFATYAAGVGLSRQASELEAVLDSLFDVTTPLAAPVAIVGHDTGGLAARKYITDTADSARISRLVTYGTPHSGADTDYWCNAAGNAGVLALGGVFGRIIDGLTLSGACANPASVGGVRDAAFSCVANVLTPSTFIAGLNQNSLPPGVTYTSVVSFWEASNWNGAVLPQGGQRGIDCASWTWDGRVPTASAQLTDINESIGRLESDRFHESEGQDLSNVICGLNDDCLVIRLRSLEADLRVTIGGLEMSRQVSEIPGAAFMTRIESGREIAMVVLPLSAIGETYDIAVTPRGVGAGTYTLSYTRGGGPATTLANELVVPIVQDDYSVSLLVP